MCAVRRGVSLANGVRVGEGVLWCVYGADVRLTNSYLHRGGYQVHAQAASAIG